MQLARRDRAARYLGYEIIVQHSDIKITNGRRTANGTIALRVPLDVIKAKRAPYRRHGKPWHRPALQNLDDYDIIQTYGAEYRGIVGYYMLAIDGWRFNELEWYAKTSMLKTLAAKHQSSVSKMASKYTAKIETPHGLRTCYEVRIQRGSKPDLVARFGGIPLVRNMDAVLSDRVPGPPDTPQGADPPAPDPSVRAMRRSGHSGRPPSPQAHQPRGSRPRPARVGEEDGPDAPQDPRGLRVLPRSHPRATCREGGIGH